jgi:hypothetical protein
MVDACFIPNKGNFLKHFFATKTHMKTTKEGPILGLKISKDNAHETPIPQNLQNKFHYSYEMPSSTEGEG